MSVKYLLPLFTLLVLASAACDVGYYYDGGVCNQGKPYSITYDNKMLGSGNVLTTVTITNNAGTPLSVTSFSTKIDKLDAGLFSVVGTEYPTQNKCNEYQIEPGVSGVFKITYNIKEAYDGQQLCAVNAPLGFRWGMITDTAYPCSQDRVVADALNSCFTFSYALEQKPASCAPLGGSCATVSCCSGSCQSGTCVTGSSPNAPQTETPVTPTGSSSTPLIGLVVLVIAAGAYWYMTQQKKSVSKKKK